MRDAGNIQKEGLRSSGHVRRNFASPVAQSSWKGGGFQKGFWLFMELTANTMPSETNMAIWAGVLIPLLAARPFAVVVYPDRPLTILAT